MQQAGHELRLRRYGREALMRWPRFRRRGAPAPQLLTFHHEARTIDTKDGPMTVRVPVLDYPDYDPAWRIDG